MFLGELVKRYRLENHLTMQEFADKTGLSKGYISMLEKNRQPRDGKPIVPSLDTFKKVSFVMGIDIDELIRMVDKDQPVDISNSKRYFESNIIPLASSNTMKIKVYGTVPAGVPVEAIEVVLDEIEIPADWASNGYEYFGFMVNGDSMSPKYLDGDIVIVRQQHDCESGQDCIVYVNGHDSTLKRVVKHDAGILLQPLNPIYESKFYDDVTIVGVVIKLVRDV